MASRTTKIPSFARLRGLPPDAQRTLDAIKQIIETREGLRGDPDDRFVTVRELQTLLATDEDTVGSASSSTVTVSVFSAKGSLVAGTGVHSFGEHTVGSDNTILRAKYSKSTGLEWVALQGTANRVTVTHNASDITLSAPQDIHSGASPTFADLTLSSPSNIYSLNHDSFAGFVANEHIDHSAVSISAGTGLAGGGDLTASRTLSLSHLGIENLSDPNADRIMFWDDSAGATNWLAPGNSLSISDTTLDTVQDLRTSASPTFAGLTINGNIAVTGTVDGVDVSAHAADTSNPHSVTKAQVGLGNVENVALSTWAGSTNLTTLGTISTGTWQGTPIANAYVAGIDQDLLTTSSPTFNQVNISPSSAAAPLVLNSNAQGQLVTGLNADQLDGHDASYFAASSHSHDHGSLTGLGDDDHTQYVHNSTARTISAVHTFNPTSSGAPFTLGSNAQGQLISGLNADQLDGHDASYFAISTHTHDDRYYTETESDSRYVLLTDYEDADVLAKIKNVDGSGSGLDADLLDGYHASSFIRDTGDTGLTGNYSTTGYVESGRGSGGVALTINDGYGNANVTWNHRSGQPEQNGNAGRIVVNTDATSNAYMSFQLKSGVTGGVHIALTETLKLTESSITYLGNTIWHAGNDGSGSGLDADLLDGHEASYFAISTHTHALGDLSNVDTSGASNGQALTYDSATSTWKPSPSSGGVSNEQALAYALMTE